MRKLFDFTSSQNAQMRDSSLQFFMFTFPNKGDTLDLFSLSGLSISKVFFFLLWFALTIYSPESFMGSSALQYEVEWVPFTFHSMWGVKKSKWMLVNNNMLSHYFLFWRIQKKKDAKMLWMYDWKCHLQDCTFLTVLFTKGIQLHWR